MKFCYRIRDACLGTGPVFAPSVSRCYRELGGVIWGFCFCSEDKFDAGGLVEGCILRGLDESGVGRSNHVRGKKGLEEVDRPIKASKPL